MYGAGCDFYSLKGVCENILGLVTKERFIFKSVSDNPVFHPGRCAEIFTAGGKSLGIFGQVHPTVTANYSIEVPVFLAELDFEEIFALKTDDAVYRPLPKYPATSRDFSFLCDRNLEVGTVEEVMRKAGGKLVESVTLFDDTPPSSATTNHFLRVSMRRDRTLTVRMPKDFRKNSCALKEELGITLRD